MQKTLVEKEGPRVTSRNCRKGKRGKSTTTKSKMKNMEDRHKFPTSSSRSVCALGGEEEEEEE
jgi:hypothetical protein